MENCLVEARPDGTHRLQIGRNTQIEKGCCHDFWYALATIIMQSPKRSSGRAAAYATGRHLVAQLRNAVDLAPEELSLIYVPRLL